MPWVYVGIGSNIDRDASVRAGVADLRAHYGELRLSSVYESEAVGFAGDPFYNMVAGFRTDESIDEVLATLNEIEANHGRRRNGPRFVSRTLDLDLLLYGDEIVTTEKYHLPRDEILRYAFVLWPLAEVAPETVHPETGKTFAGLWAGFDKKDQSLRPIAFQW